MAALIFWFVCPWHHRFAVDYDTTPGRELSCPACGTTSITRLHVGDCPMTNTAEAGSHSPQVAWKTRTKCVCEHHDELPTYLEGGGGKQI